MNNGSFMVKSRGTRLFPFSKMWQKIKKETVCLHINEVESIKNIFKYFKMKQTHIFQKTNLNDLSKATSN